MKLKPEEFKATTTEILTSLGDQAKVSTLLAKLTEHNDETAVDLTKATETATKLTADNEKLRAANLELFTSFGTNKPNTPNTNTSSSADESALKYEGLFDEKGELK